MSAARRVVVLCDNDAGRTDCGCEWGLALAIDLGSAPDDGGLWLWDTGQSDLFLKNAAALGLDAASARGLALSHGHYDHTGGLAALLRAGFKGSVHAHPACALERWAEEKDGKPRRAIGPPAALPAFLPTGPVTELAPGLRMLTDIPRAPGRFQAVAGFSLDPEGHRPDPVADDAFLALDTQSGPVLILGCCHSGLANSLACARERLGLERIHAVVGGLHLFNAGPDALQETALALREAGVETLMAGHCTGAKALDALRGLLPDCAVHPLAAGQVWLF